MPQENVDYENINVPHLDRFDLGTTAQMVWDTSINGFRFVKASDNGLVGVTGGYVGITGDLTGSLDIGQVTMAGNTSVSNSSVSGVNGTALQINTDRKMWYMQNLGTGKLYVKLGTAASATSFNFILVGGTVDYDGYGGTWSDDDGKYRGAVSVSGAVPLYNIWDL